MSQERAEIQSEAAQLRRVVEDQSQQVAALKAHAERMASEANSAKQRVSGPLLGEARGYKSHGRGSGWTGCSVG